MILLVHSIAQADTGLEVRLVWMIKGSPPVAGANAVTERRPNGCDAAASTQQAEANADATFRLWVVSRNSQVDDIACVSELGYSMHLV